MAALRRALPLWLVLVAAYALTLTAGGGLRPAEAHRLAVVESLVTDGDLDVADDLRGGPVRAPAPTAAGRTLEPVGAGFALVCAPAFWLGGETAVRLWLAALLAGAFTLAAALGRRLVPEPWPSWAALVAGLSPPALGAATAIAPAGAGAALLTGAALLGLHVRDAPRPRFTFACAALVAAAPWLSLALVPPAAVIAVATTRWLRRRRRGVAGFAALELVLFSGVLYLTIHDRLFGMLTPYGDRPTGAAGVGNHAARVPRLAGLLVDQGSGLLRWAPFFALAGVGTWLLVRSRRERLTRVLAEQADVEVAGTLLVLVVAAAVATAVFLVPATGPTMAAELVPVLPALAALAAWGWRRVPRVGAVLAALTVGAGVWVLLAVALGDAGLRPPSGPLPWGGVEDVLPTLAH